MCGNVLKERFATVFTEQEQDRIHVFTSRDILTIRIDLHGLSRKSAERFVRNICNLCFGIQVHLVLVHGYRRGTVLKDYFTHVFSNQNAEQIFADSYNLGITHLIVA